MEAGVGNGSVTPRESCHDSNGSMVKQVKLKRGEVLGGRGEGAKMGRCRSGSREYRFRWSPREQSFPAVIKTR